MPRIRTIKPEFVDDELMGNLSRDARLFFILLWTIADDEGRFRAAPEFLKGTLFKYDSDLGGSSIQEWLEQLQSQERIQLYRIRQQQYGFICNWKKHQKISHPSESALPPPPESSRNSPESSGRIPLGKEKEKDGDREKEGEGERKNARAGTVEGELMPFGGKDCGTAFFSTTRSFDHLFHSWPEGRRGLQSNVRRLWDSAIEKEAEEHIVSMAELWIAYWSSDDRAPYAMSFERWLLNERWREKPPRIAKGKAERDTDDKIAEITAWFEREQK